MNLNNINKQAVYKNTSWSPSRLRVLRSETVLAITIKTHITLNKSLTSLTLGVLPPPKMVNTIPAL